jgi:hypothetical protein
MTYRSGDSSPRPKAPQSAYVLMVAVALAVAATIGLVGAFFRDDDPLLYFVGFTVTSLGPALSLTWLIFVSPHTLEKDLHGADNAEARWITGATSGACTDLVAAAGVALLVVSLTGIEVSGTAVLAAIIVLAAVDTTVRFRVARHRAS